MKAKPSKNSGEVILEVNRQDEEMLSRAVYSPLRIKQILVPIDFSDCSRKALKYAIPLAREHKAAISLVHIVPTVSAAFGEYAAFEGTSITKDICDRAEGDLSKLVVDEIRGLVATDVLVRTGSPADEIVNIAEKLPADIIVISTHGRSGLKHVLLGSVAERVVRHAHCPVLVVRENERDIV